MPLGFQDSEMQKLAWSFLSNPAASCTPPSQPLPRVSREDVQLSVLPVLPNASKMLPLPPAPSPS